MKIRKATMDDIDSLIKLRLDFVQDEGIEMSAEGIDDFTERLKDYFLKAIENNTFIALLAENNDEIISAAFMAIAERPPRKPFMSCQYGTIYYEKGSCVAICIRIRYSDISCERSNHPKNGWRFILCHLYIAERRFCYKRHATRC